MSDNRIPMFVTHSPKPKPEPKPERKPPSEDKLRVLIANDNADAAQSLIEEFELRYKIENGQLKLALKGTELWLKRFVTVDPETLSTLEDVRKLANCDDEVLITGESGTGKELIARAMIGTREGDFVAVNCAGLPETLIESELFGHTRGAFTGAEGQKQGLMAAAKGGVLFLDEIGELPMSVQAKLLRALQDKKIRKVGSNVEEEISCKFVCATHRNVKQMVQDGQFRQDLYARISTFELHINSLKYRECDIVPIIESIKGGKALLDAMAERGIPMHKLDLSLNVRSLQQHVKRFSVLGRITISE